MIYSFILVWVGDRHHRLCANSLLDDLRKMYVLNCANTHFITFNDDLKKKDHLCNNGFVMKDYSKYNVIKKSSKVEIFFNS